MSKFYVTTPIFYVNDKPHIGHAYTVMAADILARFHRFIGDDTYFLTGTDEHGSKIAEAAEKAGKTPQVFADDVSVQFRDAWERLGIEFDHFIRTTDPEHTRSVIDFLSRLHKSEFVYKGEYKGLYCKGCEAYKKIADLVEGKCPLHNSVPDEVSEPAYFFKLSHFQDKLIQLIASNELLINPQIRKNEVLSFLEGQPLEDIAISRQNVEWGIPLPWDNDHTVYVWVDALINYYTGHKGFWPPTVHIIGKDIIRFHCVIWPALLLAIGEVLPKSFFVHGFFTIDGKKISKSLGNAIDPLELAQEFGNDAVRLYIFKAFPYGNDGDFSRDLLEENYNGMLANELGNLVQRVLVMLQKYRNGVVPEIKTRTSNIETAIVDHAWIKWEESLQTLAFDQAIQAVWDVIKFANQRIDDTRPWDLAKTDQSLLDEVLYELLEMIRHIALLLTPILPETSVKIASLLGIEDNEKNTLDQFNRIKQWGILESGKELLVKDVLFPRRP